MITDLHEIEKIIRNTLIEQTNLSGTRILNGQSIRGQDLSKLVGEKIYKSYNLKDNVIIFNLTLRDDQNVNFTDIKEEENNVASVIKTVGTTIKLTIYGNSSINLAQIIKARFETEKVRYDLLVQGLYIEKIRNTFTTNEIINDTYWQRVDLTIDIDCEMEIQKITNFDDYASKNDIIFRTL